ncbi:MAG: M20/M25/M40 family metallo-hydrolase, partial [Candidatus Dormibacteria bacterium]
YDRAPAGPVPALRLEWGEPDATGVLLLGHLDTVWDRNAPMPQLEVSGGRVRGPGVFDMKGGVVVALAALAALQQRGRPQGRVTLVLTGDEEVGSGASRPLIEKEARRNRASLVLEPPLGEAVKVARRGIAQYRLTVRGRAAHAGLDPASGVNSVVALASLVERVARLGRPRLGTFVSPTVFQGGTRTNVIPALAELDVDVRFPTSAEASRVDGAIRGLFLRLPRAELEVKGGINRPPFESSASSLLFELAQGVAGQLGWAPLEGAEVGGGSDGNLTAALGVPTLDGMGIVGGGAHALEEWAELASIPERGALLAGCLLEIWGRPWD